MEINKYGQYRPTNKNHLCDGQGLFLYLQTLEIATGHYTMQEVDKADTEAMASQLGIGSGPTITAEDDKRLLRIIDSRSEIQIKKQTQGV